MINVIMNRFVKKFRLIDRLVGIFFFLTACSAPSVHNSADTSSTSDTVVQEEPANTEVIISSETHIPIEIDSITWSEVLYKDCDDCSHPTVHYSIPIVNANAIQYNDIVVSINTYIENILKYEEYDGMTEKENWEVWAENNCHGIDFRYEISSNILYLGLLVVWYDSRHEWYDFFPLMFDLTTGKIIEQHKFPFSTLFSLKGYFEFLNKRDWSNKAKREFKENFEALYEEEKDSYENLDSLKAEYQNLAEIYVINAKYDINYRVLENLFKFDIHASVMPIYARALDPYLSDKCTIEEVTPYLSEIGKKYIQLEQDTTISILEKTLRENELYNQIEDCLYFEMYLGNNTGNETSLISIHYTPCSSKRMPEENETYLVAINYNNPQNVYGYLFTPEGSCENITGTFSEEVFMLKADNVGEFTVNLKDIYIPSNEPYGRYSDNLY